MSNSFDPKAALAEVRAGRAAPAALYTAPEVFARERDHILLKDWFFLCREDMLAAPGDFRTFETPGGSVVLVRGADGVLRGFANHCRHRGAQLLEGEGNCGSRIVCPYHAWTYKADGALAGAPGMADVAGFERSDHGLTPLTTENWAGFVFATFNAAPRPLSVQLGDAPARFASHKPDRLRATWRKVMEPRCNWKLLLENAMETYHTGVVHRKTIGAQTQRAIPTVGDWLCMQVLSDRSIGSLPGDEPPFPSIPDLDESARQGAYFSVFLPAVQFVWAQDCMWWLNVTPLAVDRSRLEIGGCFPVDVLDDPDFEEKAKVYYARWEAVAWEDVGILERQQQAMTSVLYRPGPLSPRDDMVQALSAWALSRLACR
ncbi:aromatic ring-hydroxylating dioxygenase subunit alpha [Marivibrio halodurans]|uniref:Aromatic ring-hydroxylating dioxygenase subunit alpha n=1 Tax=Marivibrio halodurans TaxID=2039722 RepID=A0A8J7RZE3_9PROT|nr:aromatic ring-hydroxylating dioxygenase subunit alpha [Marivibrio halodurans]MBP5857507.1 aromatic ring-hydroxylating dioxygenase subunit alpha [Marivibrio halodurans]